MQPSNQAVDGPEVDARVAYAGVNRVLVAEEAAADEDKAVALGVQGYGLAEFGRVILYCDVLESYVAAFNLDGVRAESAHRLVCFRQAYVGMVIKGDDCLVGTFATDFDVGEPRRDDELFLVNSVLDVDYLVVFHESAANLDGFAYGAELSRAVARNEQGVGVIVRIGRIGGNGANDG